MVSRNVMFLLVFLYEKKVVTYAVTPLANKGLTSQRP